MEPYIVLDASQTRYHVVRTAATALGWLVVEGPTRETEVPAVYYDHPTHVLGAPELDTPVAAHVLWLDKSVTASRVAALQPWQRLNHFAGMDCIARKAVLFKRLMSVVGLCSVALDGADPQQRSTTGRGSRRQEEVHKAVSVDMRAVAALRETVCTMAPQSFSIPSDLPLLERHADGSGSRFYIVKPNKGCQGRGIVLTQHPVSVLRELLAAGEREQDGFLVQEYVDRPLLIEGKKFDLRLYVVLLSVRAPTGSATTMSFRERMKQQHQQQQQQQQTEEAEEGSGPSTELPVPIGLKGIQLYLHKEGLVRICADPYAVPTTENSTCASVHLTNYAANRQNPNFAIDTSAYDEKGDTALPTDDEDGISEGNKRDLRFMASFLNARDPSLWARVRRRLCACVALTVLSGADVLQREMAGAGALRQHRSDGMGCFELLGFDIMLREADAYDPVLMEVNHSPSIFCGTSVDFAIKQRVLTDTLRLVGSNLPLPSQCTDGATYAKYMTQQAPRMHKKQQALLRKQEVQFMEVLPHYRVCSEGEDDGDWSAEERAQQIGMMELSKLVR